MVLKGADLDGGGVGQRTPEVFARARPHLQPVRIMDGPAKIVEAPPPCRTEEEHAAHRRNARRLDGCAGEEPRPDIDDCRCAGVDRHVISAGHALAVEQRMDLNGLRTRSEEHTAELQPLMRTSYAVFCLQKKN